MDASPTPVFGRWIIQISGLAAILLSAIALIGWLGGWRGLSAIQDDYVPMAPNTSLSMMVLGALLLAFPKEGSARGFRRIVWIGPCLVLLICGLRLIEILSGNSMAVDRWFFRVPREQLGAIPLGEMSLPSALCFLLTSASMLMVLRRSRGRLGDLAGVLALLVAAIGLVFTLGYVYGSPMLYGGQTIPIALNSAVGFVLLGIGLVVASGESVLPLRLFSGRSMRARLLRAFLPFILAVVLLDSWLTHLVTMSALGSAYAAFFTALSVVVVALMVGWLCTKIAQRVGRQLEEAEAALQRAHDELEQKVIERTQELAQAKILLEVRNEELQRSADELTATAESVRHAHEDLQKAHQDLKSAETQLVQAEKLSALGQMVAGIAHEINNPLAFVSNNVSVLQRDVGYLQDLIQLYQQAESTLTQHQRELQERIEELAERVDLTYVLGNMNGLMQRSHEGLRRIQQIVKDLRDFARLDTSDLCEADINQGVEMAIHLVDNRAKLREIELNFEPVESPTLLCYPGKINQVILNLLTNAVDACPTKGKVWVYTKSTSEEVEIQVLDNGSGIDPAILDKIFDPFFTTKPIGAGTGLGLSISYGIIRAHGGRIEVDSTPGQGSRFSVLLPIESPLTAHLTEQAY